jgi:hypothetical protein
VREVILGEVLARQQVIDKSKTLLQTFAHGNRHRAVQFDNRGWLNPKQLVTPMRCSQTGGSWRSKPTHFSGKASHSTKICGAAGLDSTTKHFASRLKGRLFLVRRDPHRRVQDVKGN